MSDEKRREEIERERARGGQRGGERNKAMLRGVFVDFCIFQMNVLHYSQLCFANAHEWKTGKEGGGGCW